MRMSTFGWFALGFASSLAVSGTIAIARAADRVTVGAPAGYVVAESRFSTATVRGAVRNTSLGPQVQLPGGSWIYCRRSCSETLRVETVDFWNSRGGNAPAGGEGGLLNLHWRW